MDSIAAGFVIGIGGMVFLSSESKIISCTLFVIGMFTICTMKFNLFTGKACYIFDNGPEYLVFLLKVWIGNLIGAWFSAFLVNMTRLSAALNERGQALVNTKAADSLLSLFVLGALCGVLIYITVDNYAKNPHEVGKYVAVFMGVIVFLMCGFEHSIADMFYFSLCNAWNGDILVRTIAVSLGNVAGGVFLPLLKSLRK